ncbi:MAG: CHRD domain-containing protein [Pseudomonadota bacterium]
MSIVRKMFPINILVGALAASGAVAAEGSALSGVALRADAGAEAGVVFEAWLSPHQEAGEERDTPALVPRQFKSTTPSVDRDQRSSRGHGTLTFTRDFSKAYVHLKVAGVKVEEINMFHIHCGRPGQLGPIIVDFGRGRDLTEEFAEGEVFFEVSNSDIVATAESGHGVVGALTAGCPIVTSIPADKVKTVAGMANIAHERELYFNLHTTSQTYFGDIRGQLHPVSD